jgi:hypothetical protein
MTKQIKNNKGATATNKEENLHDLESHWITVFNWHTTYDVGILEEIPQLPMKNSLGTTPKREEIKRAIMRMKSDKAPGMSQLTRQQETDFNGWHITKLNILCKGKGDQQDLNNYRGICLKESCAKIVSIIISNRLLQHLKPFGLKAQFGMIGLPRSPTHTKESSPSEMPTQPRNLCPVC